MSRGTYHLRRKPTAELPPVRALRREAKPRRVGVVVRSGVVALGARHGRGQTGLAVSPSGSDGPYLDSIRMQLTEAREMERGVDAMGRTRAERAAWASVLRGFALVLALLAGPAGAVSLVEPTTTTAGAPLTTPGNGLWACAVWIAGSPSARWYPPTSPAGGGTVALPEPAQTADLPWTYRARCLNASGWGPEATGTLELRLSVP